MSDRVGGLKKSPKPGSERIKEKVIKVGLSPKPGG